MDIDALKEIDAIRQRIETPSSNVPKAHLSDWEKKDIKLRFENGELELSLDSIFPRGGPCNGSTEITVRAEGLEQFVDIFPKPKCRFGSNNLIVDANYIKCTKRPISFYQTQKSAETEKNETCITCEASPNKTNGAEIVAFSVSLTGNFDDISSTLPFRYYDQVKVHSIYPRYGPKDGDTVIQVWGENFLDLGDDFRCNFGTRSTKAYYINDNYIWCRSAPSDVVGRPMPFSVSLNRQQNSLQKIEYWYYNDITLSKVVPDFGPITGGSKVLLKGSQLQPFDWKHDINNQNDTFCDWDELGKTPAMVLSTTEAECTTPSNPQKIDTINLRLTLNNQNYSSTSLKFTYNNPPQVSDVSPLNGPVSGGTEVQLWGQQFEKNKKITCTFGDKNSTAKFISKNHLMCPAPPRAEAGEVKLAIQYEGTRFQSDVFTYTYFASPIILDKPQPACGPVTGYTQITLKGRNFVEIGAGKAKCIFNSTYFMNATVQDSTTIVCDTPPLVSESGDMWYNISVSLDGEFISNATSNFSYYQDFLIQAVTPALGPLSGGTRVVVKGKGFNQTNVCDLRVRFGETHVTPYSYSDSQVSADSPSVLVPGQIVMAVSGNNQQFSSDKTIHFRDVENTFEYYQDFFIEKVSPDYISNSGNSSIKLTAILFDQFTHDNDTKRNVPLFCRFVDSQGNVIGNYSQMVKQSNREQICSVPKNEVTGNVGIQVSANTQNWQTLPQTLKFFNGPKVTSVSPTFGVTKNPKGLNLQIFGENFLCPENDCSKLKVRFTNFMGRKIYVDGRLEQGTVVCQIPKYPSPETLDVDVSFNDQDFTNNGVKFGYYDPFIEDVQPKLISTKGTTKLRITGYGFVAIDETKTQVAFESGQEQLKCQGVICTKPYKVIDERTAEVGTFEQTVLMKGEKNIGFDQFSVSMMDPDGGFDKNDIGIRYYKDPVFQNISSQFAYANEEKPLMIATEFYWEQGNTYEEFLKYSNISCKFTSANDDSKSITTTGLMESSPIGSYKKENLPNQIRCRTPQWTKSDQLNLEISLNGLDFLSGFVIQVVDPVTIYRISPLSGPIGGSTKVNFYGEGYNSSIPISVPLYVKFGTVEADEIEKSRVNAVTFQDSEYHNELRLKKSLLHDTELHDFPLEDGTYLKKYLSAAVPDFSKSQPFQIQDYLNYGGPVYVEVGERVEIQIIEHSDSKSDFKQPTTDYIDVAYPFSSTEQFYFYRPPVVTKIEPLSGLVSGGTQITITGAWFDQKPEYGLFPFCKIGDTVIKAKFVQTTRIICESPPSSDIMTPSPIQISLNGVDFHNTDFEFSYYERPELLDIQPRSGNADGGTLIYLKGLKFSNLTQNSNQVRCRFRQIADPEKNQTWDDDNAPSKFIPAYFVEKDTMRCASPAGWNGGDKVRIDLTLNGADYTEKSFVFTIFSIFGSFPRSAPADQQNQYIQVRGKGFNEDQKITCLMNNKTMEPQQVTDKVIKCPMHPTDWPTDKYDSVPFSVVIDGSRKDFGNFYFYRQITIDQVTPLVGPNEGRGAIYVIGRDFRDDFENAKPACRVGNTLVDAQLIDSETVRCQLSKKIPLVEEGQSLLVSVALNSYSWGESQFSFQPYGIDAIYPNSGPISQNTNILVTGKGFNNLMKEDAKCKFGSDDNYLIVQAQVLDNQNLICKSPSEQIELPDSADQEISVPFSIAFGQDIYYPYTDGPQKFKLYKHPSLSMVTPLSAQVGKLTEIYVTAENDEGFWQPIPNQNGVQSEEYGIKCKFGRFGNSAGTYINKTTILCLTPNIKEDPKDISEETIIISVAMNGVDFNDDESQLEFTFLGTGSSISTWVIILGALIVGLLLVSIAIFIGGIQEYISMRNREAMPRNSYVTQNERGVLGPRVNSRSSGVGVQGRRSAMPQSRGLGVQSRFAGSRGAGGSRAGGSRAGGGLD